MLENIFLFRHGKAENANNVNDDFARALTKTGKAQSADQAKILSGMMASEKLNLDLILVSEAKRAVQTLEAAKDYLKTRHIEIQRNLYLANSQIYYIAAQESGAKNVMIIAHNPGLHSLARDMLRGNQMTFQSQYLMNDFPPSSIAWFKANSAMASGFELKAYLRPIAQGD